LKLIFDVLAYIKGIQDIGVFFSTVFSIFIFLGQSQTVLVCQSYNGALWSSPVVGPPQRACTEKSIL